MKLKQVYLFKNEKETIKMRQGDAHSKIQTVGKNNVALNFNDAFRKLAF